jgi:hypothetical protein
LDDPTHAKKFVITSAQLLSSLLASLDFGDAAEDMTAATILLLVGGQLVLLTPRKARPIILQSKHGF